MLARSRVVATRRITARRPRQRFQSTVGPGSGGTSGAATHVAAGVAGGATVALGGYAFYHFSSLKTIADGSRTAQSYFQQAQQKVIENAKNPNQALAYLRSTAHSYASLVPGLGSYVDSTFDHFDTLAEKHGDEVNAIAGSGYDEIQEIVKKSGSTSNVETALKVMQVLQKKASELQELAKKVGGDAIGPILENHPQLKEKLGGGYEQLKGLVEKQGPEAKKIYDDTVRQVSEIFSKGFSQDAANQAYDLIQSRASEIQDLSSSSAQEAWSKAVSQAGPYLNKLPSEIKQLVEDNANKFVSAGMAFSGGDSELFKKIKKVADTKGREREKRVEELKEFVRGKAEEAEEKGRTKGWDNLLAFVKAVPGGGEALEKTPEIKEFVRLAQERGDDARELVKETYEDVLKVLQEKAKEAKQLGDETKEDAKKRK